MERHVHPIKNYNLKNVQQHSISSRLINKFNMEYIDPTFKTEGTFAIGFYNWALFQSLPKGILQGTYIIIITNRFNFPSNIFNTIFEKNINTRLALKNT